jgi:adenylate cyclase
VLFEAARGTLAAARYYSLAAQSAARLFAFEESERLAAHGLQLLLALPDDAARAGVELELQMSLALAVKTRLGYAAPAVGEAYRRARELCRQVADPGSVVPVLMGLSAHYITAGEISVCRDLAEQLLDIAVRIDNPHLRMVAEWCLGAALHHLGELQPAHAHLLRALELHDPVVHGARAWEVGIEPGLFCRCEAARATWLLGRPDEALARVERAWRDATTLGHPQTIAFTLLFRILVHQMRREVQEADRLHRELVTLCQQRGITQELLWAAVSGGWVLFHASDRGRGLEEMAAALDEQRAHRSTLLRPFFLQVYAEALIASERFDAAEAALDEADTVTSETSQRMYEPELHRLRGDLAAGRGPADAAAARTHYDEAIAVARRQGARALELRAATGLARLLLARGDAAGAATSLHAIADAFTEGRGTADVADALALLAACAAANGQPG